MPGLVSLALVLDPIAKGQGGCRLRHGRPPDRLAQVLAASASMPLIRRGAMGDC